MKTSESLVKIAPALVKAQMGITYAIENAKNPHLKNTYADLSAVIDAVKVALNANGISFIQSPSPSDDGRLHLTTRLIHESGEWIENTATCPLPKQDPQGFGSALSYLRRYSLSAFCGLYSDDNDGNSAINRTDNNVVDVAGIVKTITDTKTLAQLQTAYKAAVAQCKGNVEATNAVVKAKDEMKSLFELNHP
ncbi:Essential recombination function protein [uncultured Caudovirales phage]|uniref:Essential recombination function protein n=1 Tax=uncultured Caudovirales phage TaxID=2100421 RepID=A0A6J5KI85_9CAUD|nr:Essential recombination function protein [uncultured Caudovirales phage]